MDGRDLSPFLKMGTILACFQASGSVPVVIERLKSLVKLGAIEKAVDLSILGETPSKPIDLSGRREIRSSSMTSTEHKNSSGHEVRFLGGGT